MKLDDKYATTEDINNKDKSVISKKTLDQVAATSTTIYGEKPAEPQQEKRKKKDIKLEDVNMDADTLLKQGKRSTMPEKVKPMLATLVNEPFDEQEWTYEVKLDGYRSIA